MRNSRFGRRPLLAVAMLCLAAAGCASLPRHVHKERSEAIHDVGSTTLGRLVGEAERRNLSGIRLLASGDEALASLIALADHAERTLDIQYYIITQDESARILLQHVREAAERGVRVRILVDDFNTAGQDRRFMHLGQNAHIEVRVFNPFPGGRSAIWTRLLASFSELPRINHRMHNKLFVADNALAITGGRNIGDQYFTRDKESNFIDLDVVAAGNIVPQLSASFDAFWNSKYAYPIASLAAPVPLEAEPTWPHEAAGAGNAAAGAAAASAASSAASSTAVGDAAADAAAAGAADFLAHEIDAGQLQLAWVPATILADRPAKIASESSPDQEDTIANDLSALIRTANEELIIISPYFVPGSEGIALLRSLVRRGVHIRILTNSLAATDSPLVHIGYSHYRVELLHLGVELSEMRPKLGTARPRLHPFRSGYASLHAKAVVVDEKTVFIGSLNMDARSARINSELGLVIRSTEIARQVTSVLDDLSEDGSYRLELEDHSNRLVWLSGPPGAQQIWHRDPEATRLQRFVLKLLTPFAPEELL